MPREIQENYFEDNYMKQECYGCLKSFIVGEVLSEGTSLVCPYCGSHEIEAVAVATENSTEDMNMGCVGIYFSRYDGGPQ